LADAHTGKPLRKLISAARNANYESLRFMTSSAAFSPDGRYLAFAAQTGGRDALYLYDLQERRVGRKLKFNLDGLASQVSRPMDSASFLPGMRVVSAISMSPIWPGA
jgi:Tol biopolymer transport system component